MVRNDVFAAVFAGKTLPPGETAPDQPPDRGPGVAPVNQRRRPMTAGSPNHVEKRPKTWKPTSTKRGRQAASRARASVSQARDAVVGTIHLFTGKVIETFKGGLDAILCDVIDLLPPGTPEEACKRIVLGTVEKFAHSLDLTLSEFEGHIRREADGAEADIVELAMERQSNDSRRVTFRLDEPNTLATISYAGKTFRFTKRVAASQLLLMLLGSESHSVSFIDIAEALWKTTNLSPHTHNQIRVCKRALERELTARFGRPPREVPLDNPDNAKNQSWINADRRGRYSLNTQVLTWTDLSGDTGSRVRVCREDDLGGLLVDPKTIASRSSDLGPPDDEAEVASTANDVDAMPRCASHTPGTGRRAEDLPARAYRTPTPTPRSLPSRTSPVRLKASGATGLHGYMARKGGMSASGEPSCPPPKS